MLALLALAYFSGACAGLKRWLAQRLASPWAVNGAVTAALFAFVLAALLPFSYYLGLVRERAYGFSDLGAGAWLGQWAESSLVTIVAGLVVVELAYVWLRRHPGRRWWLRLWAVLAIAVVCAVAIDPILVEPLFNQFTPIENPAMRSALEGLAARAGIPHARIYEMDASRQSSHTNAYVVGLLGSQRIVVYDTLLRTQTPAEVEFVVGHEIGHYVMNHLWKGVAFTLVYLLGIFALLGRIFPRWSRGQPGGDIAALPLVLLIVLGLVYVSAPISNTFSRREEHQADAYGLRLTADPCTAVASFQREERTDLIYPDPPGWTVFWFFNHPSQQQRIDFARQFCRKPLRPAAMPGGAGAVPPPG